MHGTDILCPDYSEAHPEIKACGLLHFQVVPLPGKDVLFVFSTRQGIVVSVFKMNNICFQQHLLIASQSSFRLAIEIKDSVPSLQHLLPAKEYRYCYAGKTWLLCFDISWIPQSEISLSLNKIYCFYLVLLHWSEHSEGLTFQLRWVRQ